MAKLDESQTVGVATTARPPLPPFTAETAAQKARLAEDAWNTREPAKVSLGYTVDSIWRNRAEFIRDGAAFDKAYIANEVAYHKAVDSALETQLIPSANNAELKSLLQTGLKIFQGHEQHAEQVAASLK